MNVLGGEKTHISYIIHIIHNRIIGIIVSHWIRTHYFLFFPSITSYSDCLSACQGIIEKCVQRKLCKAFFSFPFGQPSSHFLVPFHPFKLPLSEVLFCSSLYLVMHTFQITNATFCRQNIDLKIAKWAHFVRDQNTHVNKYAIPPGGPKQGLRRYRCIIYKKLKSKVEHGQKVKN